MERNEKLLSLLRRECLLNNRKNFRNVHDIFSHVTTDSCSSDSTTYSDSDESDVDEQRNRLKFVQKIDSFDDQTFQFHMRMKRTTVAYIISRYSKFLLTFRTGSQPAPVTSESKPSVYMYIWYMGTTASFTQLGKLFGVPKSSAWISVRQVASCINKLGHEFVKWPQGVEVKESQRKFQQAKGIPGMIGAIDSTHIEIKAPKTAKQYYSHSNLCYSIILQAVVDSDNKFIDIACGEAGSLHDTEALQRTEIYKRAQADHGQTFPHNSLILGGPTYPSKSWLVPPFSERKATTASHRKFNEIHSAARSVAEEAFDLLKRRFPRLLKFTEQINITATGNMVASACILHNLCIDLKDLDDEMYSVYSFGISSPMFKQHYWRASGPEIGINRREELFDQMCEQKLI